jgi:hypothetical protein
MELTVEIVATGLSGPPAGAPVIVQIRDAGLQDESSTTVAEARVTSAQCAAGEPFARAQLQVETGGGYPIVWVHVDVDESGDVTKGDFITMQSYPVRAGGTMRVEVRQV